MKRCVVFALTLLLLPALVPGSSELLQYDRQRVAAGEPWRLATGQLVHWTPRMALFDLAALVALGVSIGGRDRGLLLRAVLTGLVAVGLSVHFLAPGVEIYRGASGVASALFVVAVAEALGDPRGRARAAAALALFAAKLAVEAATGRALVAGALPAGVAVLPVAHLAGAVAGLVVGAQRACFPRRSRIDSISSITRSISRNAAA